MSVFTDRVRGTRSSLAWKAPCRVATTANITLSGYQTINGVTLTAGDTNLRVLVKNQTVQTENGIYDASSGAWSRVYDFDGSTDITSGTQVRVIAGTGAGTYYVSTPDPITIDTSNIAFSTIGGVGSLTSVDVVAPEAGFTITGGPITSSGSFTFLLANDLAALEAITATDVIVYRSGADAWGSVTIGGLLSFSEGTLDIGDAELAALASVASGVDKLPYFTDVGTADVTPFAAFGRGIVGAADVAAFKELADLEPGVDYQAYSDRLADLAGITWAQGDIVYFDGTNLVKLAAGTAGYVLQTGGAGANPSWVAGGVSITADAAWNAKGDLMVATGNDVASAVTVGTNGHVLIADSAQPNGVRWGAAGTLDISALSTDNTPMSPAGKFVGGHDGSTNVQFPVNKIGGDTVVDFWDVGALTLKVTTGAFPSNAKLDSGTNDNTINVFGFSATVDQYMQGRFKPPPSWDGGTIKFKPIFTHALTSGQHTSTTSVTIGTGTKTFTLAAGAAGYIIGQQVYIHSAVVSTLYPNWMLGTVTNWNSGTRVLELDVTAVGGSGTFAAWQVRGHVTWSMKCVLLDNRASANTAMGTGVDITEPVGAPGWIMIGQQSAGITPSGTISTDGLLLFQIGRLAASGANDNCPIVVQLIGIEVQYTRSKNTEA